MKRLLIAIMLLCAVNADASVVCRGRGFAAAAVATYSTWTNTYMSYRSLWQNYQSNSVAIAYDWGAWDVDGTNLPAASEPTATIIGTNVLDVIDYAYLFDGVNDFQGMAVSRATDINIYDFTISAWCYPLSVDATAQFIFHDYGTGSTSWGMGISSATNFFALFRDNDNDLVLISATATVTTGAWYHVAATRSNTVARLYVNGVLAAIGTNAALDSINSYPSPLPSIGSLAGGAANFYHGYLDNIYLYPSVVMSLIDITNEYAKTDHAGITGNGNLEDLSLNFFDPYTPVAGYNYRSVTGTNVTDFTGNGNTAYLYGSVTQVETGTNSHGVIGYGYDLTTASGEFLNMNSAISEVQALNDMTLVLWVKHNNIADNANSMIGYSDISDANSYFNLKMDGSGVDGKISFALKEGGTDSINAISSAAALTAGTWNMIAIRFGSTGNALWVNGEPVTLTYSTGSATTTNTLNYIQDADDFRLGGLRISSGQYNTMNGAIGVFKIYDRELDNGEIAARYHWSKNGNDLEVYP